MKMKKVIQGYEVVKLVDLTPPSKIRVSQIDLPADFKINFSVPIPVWNRGL